MVLDQIEESAELIGDVEVEHMLRSGADVVSQSGNVLPQKPRNVGSSGSMK